MLAKTLVIKLDELSVAINEQLSIGGYSLYDKNIRDQFPSVPVEAFYKYYTNLSGQYHISDMQKLQEQFNHPFMQIQIVSNSGLLNVDFTRQLLVKNPAIANEYRYGSYYYKILVDKYPEFETLILGILYPVNLEIAVQSKNGTILHCGGYIRDYINENKDIGYVYTNDALVASRIEEQESNVIVELQKYIDKYLFRWTNKDYVLTDDLYAAASLAILYVNLPQAIMNIRLANCNTEFAHSFHIKQYLESHGYLGNTVDALPLYSSMWLYKNMRYYENNFGKELTMQDVVENVFTPALVPLYGFDTIHNTGNMPENLLPEAELVREVINFDNVSSTNNRKDINIILDEAKLKARSNEREMPYAKERIEEKIAYSGDDTMSTKILQSEMLSLPGKYPFTLQSVLLNLWLYSIEENDQVHKSADGPIFITNPLTGTRMSMTVANGYKVALYCINRVYFKSDILAPPDDSIILARCIPKDKNYVPTPDHLPMPELATLWAGTDHCTPKEVVDIYSTRTVKRHFANPVELNKEGTSIFLEMVRQFNVYTASEDLHGRAQLEYCMNNQYWESIPCKITIPTDYPLWLEQIGVNITDLNDSNLLTVAFDIVEQCTGLDLSLNKKQADTQKAAMEVLKHFVSYTVLTLEKVSYDKGLPTDMKILRLSNMLTLLKRAKLGGMHIDLDIQSKAKERVKHVFEEFGQGTMIVTSNKEHFKSSLDVNNIEFKAGKPHFKALIPITTVNVTRANITVPEYYSEDIPPTAVTEVKDKVYYKTDVVTTPKK